MVYISFKHISFFCSGGHFVQWSGATFAIFGRGQFSLDQWFRRRCLKIFPI